MAFLDLEALLKRLGRKMGTYHSITFDSSGGSTTTGLVAALKDYPDDWFNDKYIIITSATDRDEIRRIDDFTQSTGTLTWLAALSAAPDSGTALLVEEDPQWMVDAVNDAIYSIYPSLYVPIIDQLIAQSPIQNPFFTDWPTSTSCTGWSASSATLGVDTTYSRFGHRALQLTDSGSGGGRAGQALKRPFRLLDLLDSTVTVKAWIRAATASSGKVGIYDGSTTTYSDYHTGGGAFELLEKEVTIAADATEVAVRIAVDVASDTVQVQAVWIEGGPTMRDYRLSSSRWARIGPAEVYIENGSSLLVSTGESMPEQWRPVAKWKVVPERDIGFSSGTEVDRLWLHTEERLPGPRRIILVGRDYLTTLSSVTDRIELTEHQAELLVEEAHINLLDRMVAKYRSRDIPAEHLENQIARAVRRRDVLKRGYKMPTAVQLPMQGIQ